MMVRKNPPGNKMRLRSKMFIVFGVLCSLIVVSMTLIRLYGVSLFADDGAIHRITSHACTKVQMVADSQKSVLLHLLKHSDDEMRVFASDQTLANVSCDTIDKGDLNAKILDRFIAGSIAFEAAAIVDVKNHRILCSSQDQITDHDIKADVVSQALTHPTTALVYAVAENSRKKPRKKQGEKQDGNHIFYVRAVTGCPKNKARVIVARMNITRYWHVQTDVVDILGPTAQLVIVDDDGTILYSQNRPNGSMAAGTILSAAVAAAQGEKGQLLNRVLDSQDHLVIAVTHAIPVVEAVNWGLVVKQDWSVTQRLIDSRVYGMGFAGALEIILVLIAVFFIVRQLTRPLSLLAQAADRVQQGDLSPVIMPSGSYEEVNLANLFNKMVERVATWQHDLETEVTKKTDQLDTAYRELLKTERRQSAIAEVTNDYLHNGDVEQSCYLLLRHLLLVTGSVNGCVFSFEGAPAENTAVEKIICSYEGEQPLDSNQQGRLERYLQVWLRENIDVTDLLHNEQQAVLVNDRQRKLSTAEEIECSDEFIASMLVLPIVQGETLYGAIVLINSADEFVDRGGVNAFAATAAMILHAEKRELARVAAEEAERVQGEFLANMSHELRTPMNVVIGMSNLLLATEISNLQQNYLQKINASSQQLLALINDILDVAKIKSGHTLSINSAPFEPEQLCRDVVTLLAYNFNDSQVELHIDISREIPLLLNGDAQRLRQILNNLLGNAMKFTDQGDIVLAVKLVKKEGASVTLEFRVSDSGIGINEQQLETLFQPFSQVDSTLTRKHGGTGLGLTISRQICRLMGGDLIAHSVFGEGSVFSFTLSFSVPAGENINRAALVPMGTLNGMRVLLVDDNAISRQLLTAMLEAMKFKVSTVCSGQQAIELLQQEEAEGRSIHLVLLDSAMPELSGLDVARQIAAQHLTHAPRIMMVTPNDKEKLLNQAEALGIAAIIDKPVQASTLFDTIHQLYGLSTTAATEPAAVSVRWENVNVLLVEDNELNRQVARGLLEQFGLNVVDAVNGAIAVEMVQSGHYDLVLMDIQMPVMDGLAATRAIRHLSSSRMQQIPIVAMTANAFMQDRQNSLQAGMNDHISKPVDPNELSTLLQRWLPQHKQVDVIPRSDDNSEGIDLPNELPGIDVETGLLYSGGNKRLYLALLTRFAQRCAHMETQLRHHLSAGEQEQAIVLVHTLKGLAATIGAKDLHKLAEQLEKQLRTEKPATGLEALFKQLESVRVSCCQIDVPQTIAADEIPVGTSEQLALLLSQLAPALVGADAMMVKSLAALLRQKRWPVSVAAEIVTLERLLGRYLFAEAQTVLKEIQQRLN